MSQKILFITPPFTQLNTPYPATAYLKGFLNTKSIPSHQCDLGIEVILALFSTNGLSSLFQDIESRNPELSDNARRIFNLHDEYIHTIDPVIAFLQNKNTALAHVICERSYLPEASRFAHTDDLDWAFGTMGLQDKAKHLATLYLEDLSDLIVEAVDPHFGFSRYAERLSSSANTFDEIHQSLLEPDSFIDRLTLTLLEQKIADYQPTVVAFSVPFPGNLYSALKCGQWLKEHHPAIPRVMGGGFPNTELRSLSDPRVFDFVDFITLDDGEATTLLLLEHLDGKREADLLKRTFRRVNGEVIYSDGATERDISQADVGIPDYSDLPLHQYLSVIEIANPMHRLWNDGRWNKLTLAHGCYWGRCTFCDTSLDYIKRYEPSSVQLLVDRMEQLIKQTGQIGFHFVDEAAPPALMRALAQEIIRRKLSVVWWTNIRFEKSFSYDLCQLLRTSGCIAVSGGLEVASDRLLGMINKGVSLTKVAKVTDNFTQAGIMVHAYLMYGFPTQTAQETIDSLEVVRQLFEAGVIQSGFWHQFAMTAHSPVGLHPEKFNVKIENKTVGTFANNDLVHSDPSGCQHELFSEGLKASLYNYMHDIGFDLPLQEWFDFKVPHTKVNPHFIEQAIESQEYQPVSSSASIVWIGGKATIDYFSKKKKKRSYPMAQLAFSNKHSEISIQLKEQEGKWLMEQLPRLAVENTSLATFDELQTSFEEETGEDFILFWNSKPMMSLRKNGLLML
ncbi:radical SAM protein [uncultured Sunxiuqinia sp.]|uniref:B12-binding domain-containing radical SAM protein n=1 Tax=uncultured Sunxiuqinia sp. TaxID=1573825 RepID=UPI002628D606|nr:radical SAM protein [uncultured Sunxiuqinia sp.]